MIKARLIALNSAISIGARLIGTVLALIITGFITRYLGQEGFGYYSTVLAFLYIFSVLADFGLYSITVRDISQNNSRESEIIGNAFTLRFFGGLIVFLIGSLAVWFLNYSFVVRLGIVVGGLGYWFLSNIQVLMGVFQKYLKMINVAFGEVVGRLIQLFFIFLFIKYDYGFLGIVWALNIGAFLNFLIVIFYVRKYVKFSFCFDFVYWKKILKESLPLGLAAVLVTLYFKMDTIILSLIKPAIDVGIYNLAYKVLENLIFFPHMFIGLVMPLLSSSIFSNPPLFRKIFQKSFNILIIFVIPIIVGVIVLSKKIVNLIGGEDFNDSAGVLKILAISCGFIFLGALFSNIIIAFKKQKYLTWIYAIGAVFNLVANSIFIPLYSYYGAAWTTVATELLVTLLMIFMIYRMINFLPNLNIVVKSAIASFVMGILVFFLKDLNLAVSFLAGVFMYFLFLFLLGGFKKEDVLELIIMNSK